MTFAGETAAQDGDPAPVPATADQVGRRLEAEGLIVGMDIKDSVSGHEVVVHLPKGSSEVRSTWDAGLALGALAEVLREPGDRVASDVISDATATGPHAHRGLPLGRGAVSLGQVFASPPDDQLRAQAEATAKQFGLVVRDVEVIHPRETAVAVTFEVRDPHAVDWTVDTLRTSLVGKTPRVEGVFIHLVSADGTSLVESGVAYRTGEGGLSFAPGQDARFGALHGGLDAGPP